MAGDGGEKAVKRSWVSGPARRNVPSGSWQCSPTHRALYPWNSPDCWDRTSPTRLPAGVRHSLPFSLYFTSFHPCPLIGLDLGF